MKNLQGEALKGCYCVITLFMFSICLCEHGTTELFLQTGMLI